MGRNKAIAYAAVKDVIEHGMLGEFHENHKGRGYSTAHILAPITINGERYICSVILRKNKNSNHFYLHEVNSQKNLQDEAFITNLAQKPASPGEVANVIRKIASTKDSSKIVDENGEPLVVYHGSGESEFNVFGNRSDIGFHFGNYDQAMMRNYMTVDYEGVIRPFFLDIKNPLYIDGDAGSWKGNDMAAFLLREEPEREKGSRFSDIPRGGAHLNPFKDGNDIARLEEISKMGDEESNDAMREFLTEKGYDGIVYENDVEVSPDGENNRSYIAFRPEQIKSAETETRDDAGNVIPLSERFDAENPDIRYSRDEIREVEADPMKTVERIAREERERMVDDAMGSAGVSGGRCIRGTCIRGTGKLIRF